MTVRAVAAGNGKQDTVFPIEDMYLLLEHGSPKTARFIPDSGHMGAPGAMPAILGWLQERLLASGCFRRRPAPGPAA